MSSQCPNSVIIPTGVHTVYVLLPEIVEKCFAGMKVNVQITMIMNKYLAKIAEKCFVIMIIDVQIAMQMNYACKIQKGTALGNPAA